MENSLRYVLDVAFHKEARCIRKDKAFAKFSLLRQMALNLLRQERTCKNGLAVKRGKAGRGNTCLLRALNSCSQL